MFFFVIIIICLVCWYLPFKEKSKWLLWVLWNTKPPIDSVHLETIPATCLHKRLLVWWRGLVVVVISIIAVLAWLPQLDGPGVVHPHAVTQHQHCKERLQVALEINKRVLVLEQTQLYINWWILCLLNRCNHETICAINYNKSYAPYIELCKFETLCLL